MDSAVTAGEWARAGSATAGTDYALVVGDLQGYPSGVPGTDTADGSITLGDYLPIVFRR